MKKVKRDKKFKKVKKKVIKTSPLHERYIGSVVVVNPENSLIASKYNIKEPGKYAILKPKKAKKAKKKVKQVKKKKPEITKKRSLEDSIEAEEK
ncbi:MAG: hypothetical protein ACFFCM_02620 [Promethearchaeota archaeon]